jgi:hypothetical protein
MEGLLVILFIIAGLALYFLFTVIGLARDKRNSVAIFALNLLLG